MNGEWISVADRLPKECERVIVYGISNSWVDPEPGVCCEVYLNTTDPIRWVSEYGDAVCDVTHWMPLPSGPHDDELSRLRRLKQVVINVLAQKGDDVCWLDIYTEMAGLVGVHFDPELLPKQQFLSNCSHFHDCLARGEPYTTPQPKRD